VSLVAARLVEDGRRVLLLEAVPDYGHLGEGRRGRGKPRVSEHAVQQFNELGRLGEPQVPSSVVCPLSSRKP
jgi:hypothetical protein